MSDSGDRAMKTLLVSSEYNRNSSFTNSKKHLPIKSLVNSNADIPQISINPGLPLKVRKADALLNFAANYTLKLEVSN